MQGKAQSHNSTFGIAWDSGLALMIVLLVLIVVVLFIVFTAQSAQAQTFTVIHYFTGPDGVMPMTGLTIDAAGNLYGTTYGDNLCDDRCGTVFKLSRESTRWTLNTLYRFHGGNDGAGPMGRVALAPDETLYGTTTYRGGFGCPGGCGTVFRLRPSPTPQTPWKETVLYNFTGGSDRSKGATL